MDPPVKRVRILGKCTAELAAADQSADNQQLKRITRAVLREERLDDVLKGQANEFGKLTKEARKHIGRLLSKVVKRFNSGVAACKVAGKCPPSRNAFNHTLLSWLPGNKPNNRLGKLSVVRLNEALQIGSR